MSTPPRFILSWTGDFYDPAGTPRFKDMGAGVLADHSHIANVHFAEHRPVIEPEQLNEAHGVIVLGPAVTARSIEGCPNLLAIARFGVGYDSVDVAACTRAGVLVVIASGAVDRSVAEATLTWMLALTHHVRIKDRLAREGRWVERSRYMGCELRQRTLGVIGLGGIGRALLGLVRGLGMNEPLAFDPFVSAESARAVGARLVGLDELLRQADFVSIHCPLTAETRGLIGARELALMKWDAYLINTARGGIVDEEALYDALKNCWIAGAAVDCFAAEPLSTPPRLAELDNVLLAPHCIGWTDELFRDIGRTVCQAMLDLSLGRRPGGVVNPEVFEMSAFRERWAS
jgi:phosphoglycerate dehydrogenase-like enzyme